MNRKLSTAERDRAAFLARERYGQERWTGRPEREAWTSQPRIEVRRGWPGTFYGMHVESQA